MTASPSHAKGLGVDLLLASNGYVWISPARAGDMPSSSGGGDDDDGDGDEAEQPPPPPPTPQAREVMARVGQSVRALASLFLEISPDSILDTYHESARLGISPPAILFGDAAYRVTEGARRRSDAVGHGMADD